MDEMDIYQRATLVFPEPIGPKNANHFRGHLAKALEVNVNIISTTEGISLPFSHADEIEGDCVTFSFEGIIRPRTTASIARYGSIGTNFASFREPCDADLDKVYRFRFWVTPGCEEEYSSPSRSHELRLWEDVSRVVSQFRPLKTD
jgi:hypothetical protein